MSKMSKTMHSLSGYMPIADFYSTTPQFKFRGKSKYSSCLSLLLSIAIFIFVLVIFIYLCVILANKRNPIVVVSELPNDTENDNLYLFTPASTFQMGFGVVFLYGAPDNMYGGIYTARAAVRYLNPETNTYIYIPLELETCQPHHFPVFYPDYGRILCFKQETPEQTAELFVRTKAERSIIIQFYQCDESTGQCDANVNTMLYYSGFVTLRTSWSVDPLNYKDPVTSDMEETYAGIPRGIRRELTVSISTIEFISDNGWLFKSTETETVLNLETIDQDMYNVTIGDFERAFGITQAPFLTLVIANSGDKEVYTRKYKKIQDIFAEITGLTTLLIPIIGILLLPSLRYARLKVYERTANDLYQARKEDVERYYKDRRRHQNTGHHRSQRSSRSRPEPAHRQSTVPSLIELPNLQANPSAADSNQAAMSSVIQGNNEYHQLQVRSDREREHGPVKISFFKWVKSFCRPEPEIKILSQAIEEIEATMDIATMIEKLMEIEKLKKCIMTDDQRILFDNLDKPAFFVDGSKMSREGNQDGEGVQTMGEAGSHKPTPEEVYENLKGKEVISEIDKQLLLFYEKKIK